MPYGIASSLYPYAGQGRPLKPAPHRTSQLKDNYSRLEKSPRNATSGRFARLAGDEVSRHGLKSNPAMVVRRDRHFRSQVDSSLDQLYA